MTQSRFLLSAFALWGGCVLLAQSDRGTITGTITDPAGAVVPNTPVQVRNMETGAVYDGGSSATGNYVVQLPAGTYELTVAPSGFKRYVRQNLAVPVAQTLRIDVMLEVGSAAESVTVTEAAPLLKTESGELSHNVTTDTLNRLPMLAVGASAGAAGIRNPYAVLQVLPGADWQPDASIRLNGMPSNSQALRLEGQDSTNGIASGTQSQTQPSVEAIEEFAIQTSNFAAEFGQAGGGVFNVTMRSGTNQYHGAAYDYFVNEALNAGVPFTSDGNGLLLRPRQRRNDYGFSFGGAVRIPKVYNGHDKTFSFSISSSSAKLPSPTTNRLPCRRKTIETETSRARSRIAILARTRWAVRFLKTRFTIPKPIRPSTDCVSAIHFPITPFPRLGSTQLPPRFSATCLCPPATR